MKIQREAFVTAFEKMHDRVHSIQGHIVMNVEPGEDMRVPLTIEEIAELFPKLATRGRKRAKVTIEIE